ITFWKVNISKDIFEINTKHKYYFQLQGQLHVTGREFGFIAYWTKVEKKIFNCLLPKLVDPRHPRSIPIRNPSYILEARAKKNKKN
ncbi:YqaJ domain-containing protein, partial [Aphis craccivora]